MSGVTVAVGLGSLELESVTDATGDLATYRAQNSAIQNRLGFASDLVSVNKANLEAATSRITDADVAIESTSLARFKVLVEAGAANVRNTNIGLRARTTAPGEM